jgi:hypothetical protein
MASPRRAPRFGEQLGNFPQELVGLAFPRPQDLAEIFPERVRGGCGPPQPEPQPVLSRVPEPGRRQHVQRVGVRPGVGHRDGHQQVVGAGLGLHRLDHPVLVVVQRPERPLLQDQVAAVPQRQAEAQPLLDVAEPGSPSSSRPNPATRSRRHPSQSSSPFIAVGAVTLSRRPRRVPPGRQGCFLPRRVPCA